MKEAAQAAAAIRKELKEKFPSIVFSVRSRNYAGGNSIDVGYTNGVPTKEINAVVNKYQDGDFDGMVDLYTYRDNPQNLPRAKYVMVSREISPEIREAKKLEIAKHYGIKDPNYEPDWRKIFSRWSDQVVWEDLSELTL